MGMVFKTKTIRQSVTFKAAPEEVYGALMDSSKHSEFSGAKASISNEVGGKFTAYGGGLEGTNLELVPGKKIVQAWRAEMEHWPKGHYSKVVFLLKKVKDGTRLAFTQSSVPVACFASISQGWHDYYWKPMKKMLER